MNQCQQSPGLVARQPVVDALVRDPVGLGDLTDPTTVPHDPQDGVGTLFRLAELHKHSATSLCEAHGGSVEVSGIARTSVQDQAERFGPDQPEQNVVSVGPAGIEPATEGL